MGDWIKDPSERKQLADTLHGKHRREKLKTELNDGEIELAKIDNAWKAACDQGKASGYVSLCWLDMKHIGERVYSFERDYGRKLLGLRLDGIGLRSMEGITNHCLDIEKLSLASNCIKDISSCDIQNLSRLTQLNLLRNQLTQLPTTIGLLNNLTRLDVANNKLTELPAEVSNLRGLKQLILEDNELVELPDAFGKLECEVLNLNSNKFIVCPSCIIDMKQLRQLSINGNEIGCLPSELRKLKKLESLHASKNRITVLPDSIVGIYSLQCLWFDFNKLSAIPPNFHRLTRLKELKLEGNVDLVYPPIRIVAKGTEEVLRWSRNRLEMAKSAKIRHIVQSLEEVLNQVQRHRIGGRLHESLFEVVDDNQFQFPPDALWNIFLPELQKMWSSSTNEGIKSFPYERTEVEQAMFHFRDAAGPIVKKTARARFRRCSCMETGQSSLVCIPPKTGWMCTRPALLLRKECYEENMREKRRKMAEEKSVADSTRAAKNLATAFLASEEGILTVREEAMKRMALLSCEDLTHSSSMRKIFKKVSSSVNSRRSETKAMLKQIEEEIRDEYLREKINTSRNDVLDRNKRIAWIMQSWMGLSLWDAFEGWRYSVELANSRRRREQRNELKEERLRFEDELAQYEYDKIDVSHWNKSWDEWNDVEIWRHAITNETRYDEPETPPHPQPPKSLVDPTTGLMLTRQEIQENEADTDSYSSSDSDSLSSAGSNEGNNENANESAKLEMDEAPKGMNSELELAKRRVLEIQRNHVLTKYKM